MLGRKLVCGEKDSIYHLLLAALRLVREWKWKRQIMFWNCYESMFNFLYSLKGLRGTQTHTCKRLFVSYLITCWTHWLALSNQAAYKQMFETHYILNWGPSRIVTTVKMCMFVYVCVMYMVFILLQQSNNF